MTKLATLVIIMLCVKAAPAAAAGGQEIADKFGDDLSFASKQVIRGFTSIFGPLLQSAGGGDRPDGLQHVLVRDGLNAIGKGVKASATVLSTPARVLGTGITEAKKVGEAAMPGVKSSPDDAAKAKASDGAKVASTLLNTTASQFTQANLGAVLVEVALKNRIKDEANKTRSMLEQGGVVKRSDGEEKGGAAPEGDAEEPVTSKPSQVDRFLEQFNEAVRQNDGRLRDMLQDILKRINPPKKDE